MSAEYRVLGGLMIDASKCALIDWLPAEAFSDERNASLYRLICDMHRNGDPVDVITVAERSPVGWSDHELLELTGGTPSAANVVAYAEILLQEWKRSSVARVASALVSDMRGDADLDASAMSAVSKINEITATVQRSGPMSAKPALKQWFSEFQQRAQSGETMTGLPTPWAEINALTYGLDHGRLYVIAGRPGAGKSVLGENLWSFTAMSGKRALMFSLEMPASEMLQRSIASRGGVSWDYLRNPAKNHDDSDASRMASTVQALAETPLLIDETPAITIQQLSARAEREHLRSPLSLIVVDHMHIIGRPRKNDVAELGEISAGLKSLSKRLSVPVVALAQLNRGNTQRTDKRPTMADLRGSGEIEQDSDVIFLAHREDYYHLDDQNHEKDHCIELIIGKGRNMPSGGAVKLLERFSHMQALDWDGHTITRREIQSRKKSTEIPFGAKR